MFNTGKAEKSTEKLKERFKSWSVAIQDDAWKRTVR